MAHYPTSKLWIAILPTVFLALTGDCFGADGDPDPTFGVGGIVTTNINPDEGLDDVFVLPDGKILAVGASQGGSPVSHVIRYNPNGSLDVTFGDNGKIMLPVWAYDAELQPDGKLIFISNQNTDYYVGRLNADGSIDTTFNGAGFIRINFGGFQGTEFPTAVKLQADGKIVVGGSVQADFNRYNFGMARLKPDGAIDATFGSGGRVITNLHYNHLGLASSMEGYPDIAIQADGKIVVIAGSYLAHPTNGSMYDNFITMRYQSSGSPDTTFDGDGIAITRFGAARCAPSSVTIQSTGRIVVAGVCEPHFNLHRVAFAAYTNDGSLDQSFGMSGKIIFPFTLNGPPFITVQADNKVVLLAGTRAMRLYPNGMPDVTFGNSGTVVTVVNGRAPAIQGDGKIIVAGSAGEPPNRDFAMARLSAAVCTGNCPAPGRERIADFDGDGKTDLSVFRDGIWYINNSGANDPNSFYGVQWGLPTDRLTPADFDGDGKTDIAVWRQNVSGSLSYFYVLQSQTNTFSVAQIGVTGDDPRVVGDWDGDGIADLAVYRPGGPSFFLYKPSSQPAAALQAIQWGTAGDEAIRGDFDGDGRMDAAVYRASNGRWYVSKSFEPTEPTTYTQTYWGLPSDKRVSGDFDGDGQTDHAIFRDGFWGIIQSSNNEPRYQWWGVAGDSPVAGDYNGDGRTDIAVWREGVYYILPASGGEPIYMYFGLPGDQPIASALVR